MKLYYLVWDGGDGSHSVEWFKNADYAQQLIDEEDCYRTNDDVGEINLPDGFDVRTLGVSINESEPGDEHEGDDDLDEEE